MEQNPTASWQVETSPDLVGGLKRGIRGGWKQVFTASDQAIFEEVAGEALNEWGYETLAVSPKDERVHLSN